MRGSHPNGRSAIVTGGTRGIGLSIARALSSIGIDVALCGRNGALAEQVAGELASAGGGRAIGAACDVADYASCRAFAEYAERELGPIDVLINNAGIGSFSSAPEMPPEEFRRVIDINLVGVFNMCHAVIPSMRRAGRGYIINISSLAGKNPFAGGAAYNASKFALNGFSEALMQDVRYDDIRVSYVCPGSVASEFAGNAPDAGAEWKLAPEDIAEVVVDLLHFNPRALPSCIEIRPSRPPKK